MSNIVGNQIFLRPIDISDTSNIVKWRNTEFVKNNFLFREKFTLEMHNNWLKSKVETGDVIQYIICLNDSTSIGSVYFRDVDRVNKCAEFGIFIGEEGMTGKGLGLEATMLFTNYGFCELGFNKIILRVIKTNNRALNVYKKIGFKYVNTEQYLIESLGEEVEVVFMELGK